MKVVAVSADAVSRLSRPPSRAKKDTRLWALYCARSCAPTCAYSLWRTFKTPREIMLILHLLDVLFQNEILLRSGAFLRAHPCSFFSGCSSCPFLLDALCLFVGRTPWLSLILKGGLIPLDMSSRFAFTALGGEKSALPDPVLEQMCAGAFESLSAHLRTLSDEVQNMDMMTIGGFCRNCLAKVRVCVSLSVTETSFSRLSPLVA